jgi:tyrosyl-tRNA synthetase
VAAKRLLARTVVDLYHGDGAGEAAEAAFDRVFKAHEAPEDIPERELDRADLGEGPVRAARVLALAGLVTSNKEGTRMIQQGAVRIEGEPVQAPDLELDVDELNGKVFQVGRRKWARVRVR